VQKEVKPSAFPNTAQLAIAFVQEIAMINPFSAHTDSLTDIVNKAIKVLRSATDKRA